ncbi:hypothetical protein [Staphylococcus aureus]
MAALDFAQAGGLENHMTALESLAPALAMLAAFTCLMGGGVLIVKGQNRQKGVLMLVMAAVLVGNVVIWTL